MAFILSSWKRSYRRGMAEYPQGCYYDVMGRRIDRLLERGMRLAVRGWSEDPDYIVGWCAFGPAPGVIHYVYVRDVERGRGYARELINVALRETQGEAIYATHWTPAAEEVALRGDLALYYRPSLITERKT